MAIFWVTNIFLKTFGTFIDRSDQGIKILVKSG